MRCGTVWPTPLAWCSALLPWRDAFSLRALGERIGWGFQLQSPGFVVVLAVVFFLFGLNLMGVFELGGRLVGADNKVARRKDVLGSFGMGDLRRWSERRVWDRLSRG